MLSESEREPVELGRRAWEDLAAQQMERRMAHLGSADELPRNFAEAAG